MTFGMVFTAIVGAIIGYVWGRLSGYRDSNVEYLARKEGIWHDR